MKRKNEQGRRPKRGARARKNPIMKAFATRFRAWREASGLRQRDVAKDLDLCTAIISEWENGNRFPNADHLRAVAEYTGIPAWKLIKSTGD